MNGRVFQACCKEVIPMWKSLGSCLWCILHVGNKAVDSMLLQGMQQILVISSWARPRSA